MSDIEIPNPKPDTEQEIEPVSTDAEPVTESDDAPETVEDEASTDTADDSVAERDYLAPSILDSITIVTTEQLKSMEDSEVYKEQDTILADLVNSSVGDIREDKVITGRVIGTNDREVLVDIGFKSEGIVPKEEFVNEEIPQIGDEIIVYLVKLEDNNGQTVLSKEKADFMRHWTEIREKAESGETILGRISRRIKGGMIVDLGGVPAFLPGSQIDIRPVQDFDDYIGQELEFKIVKLNESRKNIVLSRKELLEADMMEKRRTLIADLETGQILEGRVKNITDFGVFVDLGGLDGLLHITDLSWGRVSHPSEIVNLDDPITVKVIDFDPEKQRVSLGLKQLQPHPWDSVDVNYPVGSVVNGKVVSMTNYGAFVEIEKGVEGLVHVSEMSWTRHIRHPSEMFTLGESIEAKILHVDTADRKISLGVKQLQPDPWDQIEAKYVVGTIQKGLVRNLTQFGAFVELEEGIDGLIHISDLSWTVNVRHPKEILSKGDEVEVRVLDVSREKRRIALGLRQVTEDPWDEIETYFTSGKQVQGEVYRILDKGVILKMEMGIEGIIPLRDLSKHDRHNATANLQPGLVLEVTVQELSAADKKVVLMADVLSQLSFAEAEAPTGKAKVDETKSDQNTKVASKKKKTEKTVEEATSEPEAATEGTTEETTAKKITAKGKATAKKTAAKASKDEAPPEVTEEGVTIAAQGNDIEAATEEQHADDAAEAEGSQEQRAPKSSKE